MFGSSIMTMTQGTILEHRCFVCDEPLIYMFVQPELIEGRGDSVMVDCKNPQCELHESTRTLNDHIRSLS